MGDGHNVCTMRRKQRGKGEQPREEREGAICWVMARVATEPPQPRHVTLSELNVANLNEFYSSCLDEMS